VFTTTLPAATWGTHTQFRWRQLSNSGTGFDQWALDDFRLQALAPPPPNAPPFIISSANSSTAIALFWAGVNQATSYSIERKQGSGSWNVLASVSGSVTYFTDITAVPATAYSYRVQALNAGGASPYSATTTCLTWSQKQEWIYLNFGSLNAIPEQALETGGVDGTVLLLRFAFNLNADESWRTYTPDSGSGAPAIWLEPSSNRLRVEFARRKTASNPDIVYQVQFSNDLVGWTDSNSPVSITPIDSIWERVVYEDTTGPAQTASRLCRVTVASQ
jgi:hypothetical protein